VGRVFSQDQRRAHLHLQWRVPSLPVRTLVFVRCSVLHNTTTSSLPVHDLYDDVFQKVKAAGFSAVSFYTFWGLHEPKRGAGIDFSGFRAVEPFIQAAQRAGLYLIARPGPYINAETTAGGFPGWGVRDPSIWRTRNASYTEAWQDYISFVSFLLISDILSMAVHRGIGELIAKYQITNGGPIILVQSENEYTGWQAPYHEDLVYEKDLIDAFRAVNVTVPLTHNDAYVTLIPQSYCTCN
jgi:hypothetical protein